MAMKTAPKLILITLALGGAGLGYRHLVTTGVIARPNLLKSVIPLKADTITANIINNPSDIKPISAPSSAPASVSGPRVRGLVWAWNAQMGLMYAVGGPCTTQGSLMEKYGVNVCLTRQDDTNEMGNQLLSFANELHGGAANPAAGAHFIIIMGDGAASFLAGVNPRLKKLGNEYIAEVVGSVGYSRGEDKFMGLTEWKQNPQAAKGAVIAGVERDGDWNIAMKWAADNEIPNNPDDRVYDPEALNWINAETYTDAASKYVAGFCDVERPVKGKKGEMFKPCVNGVVTWTPGDVTVAQKRGGLVSILSTKENAFQMPGVVIMIKKWASANRNTVEGMLAATFAGGDQVKVFPDALTKAAGVSAAIYKEQNAAYWAKYYHVVVERDHQGQSVELGGSSASNLADNLQLFGLAEGSANIFKATYEMFGGIVVQQYPNLLKSFPKADDIFDTSFVANVGTKMPVVNVETTTYTASAPIKDVVGRRNWHITFPTGSAVISTASYSDMEEVFNGVVITKGVKIQIHGHTDNTGNAEANMGLSERRAFAVKQWLQQKSASNFPEGRIKVIAHGQSEPLASNATEAGRAQNRRVEIVLGTIN